MKENPTVNWLGREGGHTQDVERDDMGKRGEEEIVAVGKPN